MIILSSSNTHPLDHTQQLAPLPPFFSNDYGTGPLRHATRDYYRLGTRTLPHSNSTELLQAGASPTRRIHQTPGTAIRNSLPCLALSALFLSFSVDAGSFSYPRYLTHLNRQNSELSKWVSANLTKRLHPFFLVQESILPLSLSPSPSHFHNNKGTRTLGAMNWCNVTICQKR